MLNAAVRGHLGRERARMRAMVLDLDGDDALHRVAAAAVKAAEQAEARAREARARRQKEGTSSAINTDGIEIGESGKLLRRERTKPDLTRKRSHLGDHGEDDPFDERRTPSANRRRRASLVDGPGRFHLRGKGAAKTREAAAKAREAEEKARALREERAAAKSKAGLHNTPKAPTMAEAREAVQEAPSMFESEIGRMRLQRASAAAAASAAEAGQYSVAAAALEEVVVRSAMSVLDEEEEPFNALEV